MTKITSSNLRLADIELEARRLRAEAMSAAFSKAVAWVRKPRVQRPQLHGRAA